MALVKTDDEIEKIRRGGRILATILAEIAEQAKPGVTTKDLDAFAVERIKHYGVKSSFKGYDAGGSKPFPAVLCTSVNEEVVHVIPSDRVLKDGDIIGLDFGIWSEGLCTDTAVTVAVGKASKMAQRLITTTRDAMMAGIEQVKPGNHIGDISAAIQAAIEPEKFGIVRELVGHGVGHEVHEPPQIPNYGKKGTGQVLKKNMVLAIEPIVNEGDIRIAHSDNGWDIVTYDRKLSAHFEHTVIVTDTGFEIVTVTDI